jgi:hypothetical protein
MSDFWAPPNNPFTDPLYGVGVLPTWRVPQSHRHYIYQFFLNNIDKFGQSDPKQNLRQKHYQAKNERLLS